MNLKEIAIYRRTHGLVVFYYLCSQNKYNSEKMKREMTCLKRTNGLFTIGKRLIERLEMTYLALVNDLFTSCK